MPPANDSSENRKSRNRLKNPPAPSEPRLLQLALVGAGALGSAVAVELAEASPAFEAKTVLVVDPDTLEPRNVALSRVYQDVYSSLGEAAFEQSKAILLAKAMQLRAPTIRWTAVPVEIADLGWADLANCDLILSCTDSVLARVETAFAARSLGIPMLDAGVLSEGTHRGVHQGRVTWFSADAEAACTLCGLTEARRAELLTYAAANSLGCHPPAFGAAMGRYPEVPAAIKHTAWALVRYVRRFAACSQASRFRSSSWSERIFADGDHPAAEPHRLTLAQDCPWHARSVHPLLPLSPDTSFRDVLRQHVSTPEAWRLEFSWPVCLCARCRSCGHPQATTKRLAALRRSGRCGHCGAVAALEPLRTLSSVGFRDPEAECTPRELGMPERHLYRLRPAFRPVSSRGSSR